MKIVCILEVNVQGRLAYRKLFFLLLAIGLCVRVFSIMVVQRQIARLPDKNAAFLFPDSYQFDSYAVNLLEHGKYATSDGRRAWRTPAYSTALAALYGAFGRDPTAARIFGLMLDLCNCLLIYLVTRRLFSEKAGLAAMALAVLYPFMAYFSALVLADTLAITAVLLALMSFIWFMRSSHNKMSAGLCGLSFAFAIMVKASFALLGFFFVAFFVLSKMVFPCCDANGGCPAVGKERSIPNRKRAVFGLAIVVIAFAAGMSPWWLRNYACFGEFVPLSTMGGFTLYESNSPNSDGGPNNGKTEFPPQWQELMKKLSAMSGGAGEPEAGEVDPELAADRVLKKASYDWIRQNPGRALSLMPKKFLRTWNPVPNYSAARSWYYMLLSFCSYVPVMLLAGYALFRYRRRWREVLLPAVPALYLAALHSIFMGSVRYRLPAVACLIILAGGGMELVLQRVFGHTCDVSGKHNCDGDGADNDNKE